MSEKIEEELTPTLTLSFGDWPATIDAPEGAVVMIKKRFGQITLSAEDWQALIDYINQQKAPRDV